MFSRLRPNILYPARRLFSTSSSPTLRRSLKYNRILAGCTAVGLVAGVALVQNSATTDDQESIGSLIRTYSVYKMCSFPSLVDASPGLLSFLMKVPIVSWIAKAVVRITFFDQVRNYLIYVNFANQKLVRRRRYSARNSPSPSSPSQTRARRPLRLLCRSGRRSELDWVIVCSASRRNDKLHRCCC